MKHWNPKRWHPLTAVRHELGMLWHVFADDMRRLTGNVVSVICVIGLVAIPSLFAWFNIAASWDPFGNMSNLKFAVANSDEGYSSDLIPVKIDVGDDVVNALRANTQLDWTFTSERDAIEGTKSGEYYAAIVIPKDFSKQMMTFFAPGAKHAVIDYWRNEKKSALAPNLTGEGADEVAAEVNQQFVSTLVSTALRLASSLADVMDDPAASQALGTFVKNANETGNSLKDAGTLLNTYATLGATADGLLTSTSGLLTSSSDAVDKAREQFKDLDLGTDQAADAMTSAASALEQALSGSADAFSALPEGLNGLMDAGEQTASDAAQTIRDTASAVGRQKDQFVKIQTALQELSQVPVVGTLLEPALKQVTHIVSRLESLQNELNQAADGIDGTTASVADTRKRIKELADDAAASITGLNTDFSKDINPSLTQLGEDLSSVVTTLDDGTGKVSGMLDGLGGKLDGTASDMDDVRELLEAMSARLTNAGDSVTNLTSQLSDALSNGDMSAVKQLLSGDAEDLASQFAAPVTLKRTAVFPVADFGSTMAPYYTFVPLWTASLLIAMTINTAVSRRRQAILGDPSPHQLFLGHFGVFAVVSLLQSTVSCAGSLLFLRVQAVHPLLFMLSGWLAGLLFVLFAYTLVISFGNIGKAIGMFLLVLQVSGSAGSYPAQVLPGFMQRLSPFLPITHAINAMRAAIAGIYDGDYWHELAVLLAFVPPLLLLGLLLRKPLDRPNAWIAKQLESTHLIG